MEKLSSTENKKLNHSSTSKSRNRFENFQNLKIFKIKLSKFFLLIMLWSLADQLLTDVTSLLNEIKKEKFDFYFIITTVR